MRGAGDSKAGEMPRRLVEQVRRDVLREVPIASQVSSHIDGQMMLLHDRGDRAHDIHIVDELA